MSQAQVENYVKELENLVDFYQERDFKRIYLKKNYATSASASRSTKCGECQACTRIECGKCIECEDKPKYGGPGKRRHACIEKVCKNLKK